MKPDLNTFNDFGELLQFHRNRCGIKQALLAAKMGHQNQTMISAWENGHRAPSAKRFRDLLAILQVTKPDEVRQFVSAWQIARMRLGKHLRDIEAPLTLGDVIRRELKDPIQEVWVLASETLQQSSVAVDDLVQIAQSRSITFCLPEPSAFEKTAQPLLNCLMQRTSRGKAFERAVLKNIRFSALGPAFGLGFSSQSIALHVYCPKTLVRGYAGQASPRTLSDPITELSRQTALGLYAAVQRIVTSVFSLEQLATTIDSEWSLARPKQRQRKPSGRARNRAIASDQQMAIERGLQIAERQP